MLRFDRSPRRGRLAGPLTGLVLMVLLSAPLAVRAWSHEQADDTGWCSGDADGFRWAVIDGESKCMGDGVDDDAREALARESRSGGAPVLWLRLDGEEWMVRDRVLVDRAGRLLQPMRDLGKQMGALGGEMGTLGAEQGRRGAEAGRLAARQAALEVKLVLAEWADDEEALTGRERLALQRKRFALSRERARVERSLARVESKELGQRMEELGQRMGEMGRRMKELAKRAEREMRELASEAVAARKAERFGGTVAPRETERLGVAA